MKSQLVLITAFAFIYSTYAASTPTADKPDNCVCDQSNNSTGLPYDPCSNFPSYVCGMLSQTCKWDESKSKCAFKYSTSFESKQVSKPIANDPKPPSMNDFTDMADPCRPNPSWICLIVREACVWNESKKKCQFKYLP